MPDFLLEIGCEEIPARMIDAASQELRERVHTLLNRERLNAKDTMTYFDTPRRLAVLVPGILAAQADISEQITGPAVTVAFKDGQPTPAAHAFAKKSGMHISQLDRISTPKGDYLSARITKKGRAAREIISELLPKEISSIYWPKNMYWRKRGEVFVRPVRWVVAMLDDEVIPVEVFGIKAGNQSRGHRILADREVAIPQAGEPYVSALRDAKVLSRGEREQQIRKGLDAATRAIPGARWREDKDLLDIVVNLTEFPSAILGSFDPEYLALPEEVLVTVMRDHQKYFAVEDSVRQSGIAIRPGVVHNAACLAKADLTTELVKEFTELQGIVGGLYARVQDLDRDMKEDAQQSIATAIYDHYKPESMEDSVPRTIEGAVLSISDKADSIAGMFALGLVPSGSKDPFALRRQANGIVKIIAEHKLPLNLAQLFEYAREAYRGSAAEKKFSASLDYADALRSFFRERLEFYLRDVLGFKYDVVNAVLAAGSDNVVDAIARAEAVTKVRPSADFESISIAFKRIKNILRQASETGKQVASAIDQDALQES